MKEEVQVTPEELYYLGKCMQAKFIDYAYIAAMDDIQKDYILQEQRALETLEDKDLIEEDFSGEIDIPEEVRLLFEPVFFGRKESLLDNGEVYRIHILGNRLTMSRIDSGQIFFSEACDEDLSALLRGTVNIKCSDVVRGVFEKTFSGEQLMQPAKIEEAIKILKGEF